MGVRGPRVGYQRGPGLRIQPSFRISSGATTQVCLHFEGLKYLFL